MCFSGGVEMTSEGGLVNICLCRFKEGRHCASQGLLFVCGQKVSEYYSLGLSFMNVFQSKQALWFGIMSACLMFNVERHSIEIWMVLIEKTKVREMPMINQQSVCSSGTCWLSALISCLATYDELVEHTMIGINTGGLVFVLLVLWVTFKWAWYYVYCHKVYKHMDMYKYLFCVG